ncbi:MAG TPA: hypothetical protein VL172_02905 [Kofleriaceae bacterium]|nr:hypothetical protein [Kofleriaceae bacterium]
MSKLEHLRTLTITLGLAALTAAGACSKKKESGGSTAKPTEAAPVDLSAINGAVPKDLAGKLTFAAATAEDGDLAVVAPAGWEQSKFMPGQWKPASDSSLGFMTSYSIGSNCDGSCEPKDWKAVADKVNFSQLTSRMKVKTDDQQPGSRLVVASSDDSTYVAAAWWKDGASRYYTCSATLADDAAKAVDAFVKACQATQVNSWE